MNNNQNPNTPPMQPPVQPPVAPPIRPVPPVYYPPVQKKAMTAFDVMTILGFVASICGIFWCSIILLPLAAILCALGFARGSMLKGLAIAGFVIATVAGIGQLIYILYKNDIIPSWVFDGLFQ